MKLIYYPDSEPGISRRRRGRGFSHVDHNGLRIDCPQQRRRFADLAIPPAYNDVWISPLANGHLQATGRDARRRKQYRYHSDWSAQRAVQKFEQLGQLGTALPSLRRWIADRLRGDIGDRDTAIAAALALIDRAALRVGDPQYTTDNKSYGVTTLRGRHVRFDGGTICLSYTAKGGMRVNKRVAGARLQKVLHKSRDLPGAELLNWIDEAGAPRSLRSEHLREVLDEICGPGITPKTLRTWSGTHAAFMVALTAPRLTIKSMAEAAAARLHNTPAIARSSYIHPQIIALAEHPDQQRQAATRAASVTAPRTGLRAGEAELIAFLDISA